MFCHALTSVELLSIVAQPLHGVQAVTANVQVVWVGGVVRAQARIEGGTGSISRLGGVAEGPGLPLPLVRYRLLSGGLRWRWEGL